MAPTQSPESSMLRDHFYDVSPHLSSKLSAPIHPGLIRQSSMITTDSYPTITDHLYQDPSQLSQLLRQRTGGEVFQFTASTDQYQYHESSATASALAVATPRRDASPPPQIPVHRDLSPRRAPISPRYVKPSLSQRHTAPTRTDVVIEREVEKKMYRSLNDAMDAPGDTQPDSQFYPQFTSGIYGNVRNRGPVPVSLLQDLELDDAEPPTEDVEVMDSSQERQQQSPNITSPTVAQDDDTETQQCYDALTSPLKFETPAMAGRQRDSPILSSAHAMTTPRTNGLSNLPFFGAGIGNGGMGDAMSLTQIFNATQARTSPAVGGPNEDPIFQRPSPNFTNAGNSSPIPAALSSPIKALRTDPPLRSSSEPRAEYKTMKESQEQRRQQLAMQRQDTATSLEQDSWNEPTEAQLRMDARREKERLEKEAGRSLARVSAPPISPRSPRPVKKRGLLSMSPKYQTPAVLRKSRRAAYNGSNASDDEAGFTNGFSPPVSVNGNLDDNSPDELSQSLQSSARATRTLASTVKDKVQVPNTSSHPQRTLSNRSAQNSSPPVSPPLELQPSPQFRALASQSHTIQQLKSSKESVTIMDSQPEATANCTSSMKRPNVLLPSSPSTNQYSINTTTIIRNTGYSSQVIASSMPPRPPKYSSQPMVNALDDGNPQQDAEGVPSSPPVIDDNGVDTGADDSDIEPHEGEITYDEHAYDEHSGDEDEAEIELEHSSNLDVDMDTESEIIELNHGTVDEDTDMDCDIARHTEVEDLEISGAEQEDIPESHHNEVLKAEAQENMPKPQHDETPESAEHEDIPESVHDERSESHPEDNESDQYNHQEDVRVNPVFVSTEQPRLQRQTTVPESDLLEDTQPSFFAPRTASNDDTSHGADLTTTASALLNQTGSTELFHTAQEEPTNSHSNQPSLDDQTPLDTDHAPLFRTFNEIANQQDTQGSVDIADLDIPKFSSFNEETNDNPFNKALHGSSPLRPAKKRRTYAGSGKKKALMNLHRDPSPLIDLLPSSPLKQVRRSREESPPSASVQEREKRGAHAAENAREEALLAIPATLKSRVSRKSAKPQPQRKGALKSVNKDLFHREPTKSPLKPRSIIASAITKSPVSASKRAKPQRIHVEMRNAGDALDDLDELAGPTPQPIETKEVIDEASTDRGEAPTGLLVMPNRLFAKWGGQGFFTATCVGRAGAHRVHVRFDEGNEASLETIHVRSLDLRVGDHVKVDQTGMKKHAYVVVGFKEKIDDTEGYEYPQTDCHGYTTVVLEEKQRDSFARVNTEQPKTVSAPIGKLYLTNQMWSKFHDRAFNLSPSGSPTASTAVTPTVALNNLATPSFSRRGTLGLSFLKESINRAGSVASSTRTNSTIFSSMVFAISFTLESSDKDGIVRMITSNGGQILEDGFQELFADMDFDTLSAPKGKAPATPPTGSDELILKKEFKDLRFAALISDSHSRRTKYVQALALNIPCLHLRWIQDSVSALRPLTFSKYLLPAGLSTFLDPTGIVRSRTMQSYDPAVEDLSFNNIVKERELLFSGHRVLMITGKSKQVLEKKKPYLFLTHILGPESVGRCTDLETAKNLIKKEGWDWVYVDDGPSGVLDVAGYLFTGAKPATKTVGKGKAGRKRKRDEAEEPEVIVRSGMLGGKKIYVACDEFVIQSLILGALVDE
jgi:hypothetical protein